MNKEIEQEEQNHPHHHHHHERELFPPTLLSPSSFSFSDSSRLSFSIRCKEELRVLTILSFNFKFLQAISKLISRELNEIKRLEKVWLSSFCSEKLASPLLPILGKLVGQHLSNLSQLENKAEEVIKVLTQNTPSLSLLMSANFSTASELLAYAPSSALVARKTLLAVTEKQILLRLKKVTTGEQLPPFVLPLSSLTSTQTVADQEEKKKRAGVFEERSSSKRGKFSDISNASQTQNSTSPFSHSENSSSHSARKDLE